MPKSVLWQAFLIVCGLIALWYTAVATYRYHNYTRLTAQIRPQSLDWRVAEVSDEQFVPEATYTFKSGAELISGQTTWLDESYRNQWGAEQALPDFSKKWRLVWYDPNDVHHSSLQKKVPFKECISAVLLWAFWLYFVWLGYYVSRFKGGV